MPFFFFKNCVYFWLCWVFVAAHRLSLDAASRSYSPVAAYRLLIAVASLFGRHMGSRARASIVVVHALQQLWCMDLVAPQHVGSSWTRD